MTDTYAALGVSGGEFPMNSLDLARFGIQVRKVDTQDLGYVFTYFKPLAASELE